MLWIWLLLAFLAGVVAGLFLRGALGRLLMRTEVERQLLELEEELRQMKERGEKPEVTEAEKAELWAVIRELKPGAIERLREMGLLDVLGPEPKRRARK